MKREARRDLRAFNAKIGVFLQKRAFDDAYLMGGMLTGIFSASAKNRQADGKTRIV